MTRLPGARFGLALAVLVAGLLGPLLLPAGPAQAVQAAQGQNDENLVKVIVVPGLDQTGGQPVTLPQVAAATLGDQNRAGEIFELNQGRRQPDGSALGEPGEQLRPGWILRLPDDASGQLVQLARETGDDAVQMDNGQVQGGNEVSFPLAALLAAIGSVLLALVTAAIVARRRVSGWLDALRRVVHRLGEPARRRRRLRLRQWLTGHFASDSETVRRAYGTVGTLASDPSQVHALRVDGTGVSVWISADTAQASPPAGWQPLDSTRWRTSGTPFGQSYGDGTACLVRVGGAVDDAQAAGTKPQDTVFVDLSRLDGVLSVTGDPTVARDVVRNLLSEVAALQPGTPVIQLGNPGGLEIPVGLNPNRQNERAVMPHQDGQENATVRVTARRRPIRGLVVVIGEPDSQTLAELLRLCGSSGEGWTGLVAGDVEFGAHWRWHAQPAGELRIPVLDLEVTAPA